jgi:hypothetical protein
MNISQLLTKLKTLVYSKSETDSLLGGEASSSHTHTKSQITDFPSLATVATSGSYSDLSNKPTIPTVNNATLTIQKNSSNVATFTANASSNVTANISVPTKVSELTNDSGFLTSHQSLSDYSTKANTVKSISISGKTITVTPGSGSAYTLTTQDTTYSSLPANGGTSTATAYMNQYDTITYGVNRLQYYNISTSTTSGAANNANPTNDWYYHLLMSHANSAGYYGDLAMCFHANTLAFRRIQSGSDQGWCYLVKNGRTIVSGYEVYVG